MIKHWKLGHLRHLNIVIRDNVFFNDLIDSQWRVKVVKEKCGRYGRKIETVQLVVLSPYSHIRGIDNQISEVCERGSQRIENQKKYIYFKGRICLGMEHGTNPYLKRIRQLSLAWSSVTKTRV